MSIVILGSGGWIPTERRETACTLVRRGDQALLLDAGTGARRLIGSAHLDGVRRLDVVLTHFHLDHVCGLSYLPALPLEVRIWAPGRWLYGSASEELLGPLRDRRFRRSTPPSSATSASWRPARSRSGRSP